MIEFLSGQCDHQTVMKNMCAECGADLEQDMSIIPSANKPAQNKISIVHSIPELKVSDKEAQNLGREDEKRLLNEQRLVLLVDLDQTLIHTTNENIPANMRDVKHFRLHNHQSSPWYHTKIRPKTEEFLEKISKLFELHIVTFGARMYAHTIAEFLDPGKKYFSHRILSRDECFDKTAKTANLSSLFPCGDHMVCIIDDREDVWNFAPNLVHVKPYNFFKNTGDINAPPGSADRARAQQSPSASSLPKPPIKKDEPDDKVEVDKMDDAEAKDQSTVNDDLELSDDEMDKDSGSSSSNEAGDADKPKDDTVDSKGEPD